MLIYHYTNTAGLLGILGSGVLWATDSEYLNDAQELQYGRGEMVAALREQAIRINPEGEGGWDSDAGNRATIIAAAVDALVNESPDPDYPGPYVVCFCDEGDVLSQWRGYAGGHGWAIGFDADELSTCVATWDPSESALQQVTYGEAGISKAVERAVRLIAPGPTGHPGVKGNYRSLVVCRRELARIKHPAFEEEREWRLVVEQPGTDPLGFRDGTIGLSPYTQVLWSPSAVRELVIGPTAHPAQQHSAARRLLTRHGLSAVRLRLSDAPYR